MSKLNIINFLKQHYPVDTEDYEVVIMLLTLVKQGRVLEEDMIYILDQVFENQVILLNALLRAKKIASDELLDDIIQRSGLN